jgi:F0F1-type ATP synthase membrane subunit b/b'
LALQVALHLQAGRAEAEQQLADAQSQLAQSRAQLSQAQEQLQQAGEAQVEQLIIMMVT